VRVTGEGAADIMRRVDHGRAVGSEDNIVDIDDDGGDVMNCGGGKLLKKPR